MGSKPREKRKKVECLQRVQQLGRACAKFPSYGTGMEFWCDPCTIRAEPQKHTEVCDSVNKLLPPLWLMQHDGWVVIYEGKEPFLRKGYWTGIEVGRMERVVFDSIVREQLLYDYSTDPGTRFILEDYSDPIPLICKGRKQHPITDATMNPGSLTCES